MAPGIVIRPPTPDELPHLREIERAAGAAFGTVGLPEIAADDPPPLAALEAAREAGELWVAAEPGGAPVAYLWADRLDGRAHVEQVSVHPDNAGAGLGRRLVDHLAAREGGAVTLTTFRSVPWNMPYYERCGFREMAPDEIGPQLAARQSEEAAHGLHPAARVAMIRP